MGQDQTPLEELETLIGDFEDHEEHEVADAIMIAMVPAVAYGLSKFQPRDVRLLLRAARRYVNERRKSGKVSDDRAWIAQRVLDVMKGLWERIPSPPSES